MNTSRELAFVAEEVAAHWTEATLEVLKTAGLQKVSIDTELETWRTLAKALQREVRSLHAAFKRARSTDFSPRLRVSALAS